MERITRKEVERRFGLGVALWTDIIVTLHNGKRYHLIAQPQITKTGKTRWIRYIEEGKRMRGKV